MQRNHANKKKRWITASVAGVVAVTVIGTALYHDSSVALARPSLPGIEDIINGNSKTEPFTILEIVDDYPSARVGYTVAGEEPGDTSTAMAISDMASYEERAAYYMKDSNAYAGNANTNPSSNSNTPYGELKDYAFTYTAYDEQNTYTADTDGVRNGKSYGEFVENTVPNGRYIPSSTTDQVYKKIGEVGSVTIEDVYNRHTDTDGTGQFYINHVGFKKYDGASTDPRYDIDSFTKIADGDEWMSPFKLNVGGNYLTTTVNTEIYTLYQANRYVANNITAEYQDTNADETKDTYAITSTLQEGDLIYKDAGNTGVYNYYAKVIDDGYGNLVLDITGNLLTDIDANPSFAKDIVTETDTNSYAIMEAKPDTDDTAMYYISNATANASGNFTMDITMWSPANDPDYTPATAGIIDEQTEKGSWYHEWFYKGVGKKPIVFDVTHNPHEGTYDFVQNYALDEVDNYYYKGGYVNNELFKKEVLDVDAKNCSNIYVNVVTKKLQDVTKDDIDNARLVYFSEIGNTGYTGVMNPEAALELVRTVDQNNKPVVLNLSALFNGGANSVYSNQTSDAYKALSLLLRSDADGIASFAGDGAWNISAEAATTIKNLADAYNAKLGAMDLSHVAGSVFINDDISVNDAIYTDMLTAYSQTKINGFTLGGYTFDGFKEVKKDIDEEIFYLQVAQKDVDAFNKVISKATSIRYILNYGDRRVVGKTAIRVLDLEPYYAREIEGDVETYTDNDILKNIRGNGRNDYRVSNIAEVRDIFAKQWFRDNVSNTTDKITVTGMGTKEFIGKIEDVNECYDLIYIGMDTAYMNTQLENNANSNNRGRKKTKVVTNDGTQYVYRHVGDEITTTGQTGVNGTWNMGGNDITPDKFKELKNYVTAGYTVILSDEFFKFKTNGQIDGIDTDRVDRNSYLYDFVDFCITTKKNNELRFLYKNVEITSNLDGSRRTTTDGRTVLAHKEEFVKYLNISKLEVEVKKQPPLYNPYEFEDTVTNKSDYHEYIGMNADGKYTLDYEVKLKNDAAVDTTNTTYNCKLYIDHDGDGRFEKVEALDSLLITNKDSNTTMYPNGTDADGHEKYELTTGSTYTISREIPEGYVGLIPWKLVFIENRTVAEGEEAAQIKVSVQDYSAISDMTNKPTIKILQLTSGGDPDNNGNTSWNGANLRLWDDGELLQMYQQVIDFNIEVTQDNMHHFIAQDGGLFQGVDRLEKLYDYDMLVLGFVDCYFFSEKNNLAKSKEAVLAVREYMLSGRSVLFTHDLTSTRLSNTDATNWGVLANRYLRDIQGMDRYGYVYNDTQNLHFADGTALSEYHSAYDTRYNSNRDAVGFADSCLLRKTNTNAITYGEMAAPYNNHTEVNHDGVNERELYSVSRVNRGQITEYPFRMGDMEQNSEDSKWYASEFIPVDKTHHQYFQLNLETDYDDTNYDDDIVVWYTISEHGSSKAYYASRNVNDVRNNYYIYSKGNITYTGAGHNAINGTPEKKLFVNTLVASYNAGTHAPYAAYKNSDQIRANDITSKYLPYDISLRTDSGAGGGSGWLDTSVTIYFKTVNNNLQDNLKPTVAQYYVEVPEGTTGAVKIGTKSYKIIVPTVVKDCTSNTVLTDKQVLSNGHIYELKFNISDLMDGNLENVNRRYHAVIYTRMRSQTRGTIDSIKAELASTEELESLPASDSMKPLNINFTQLYDLK